MDNGYASYYTCEVLPQLILEMKKIVLKVIKQCVSTSGVEKSYILHYTTRFFLSFWNRTMCLDGRNYS